MQEAREDSYAIHWKGWREQFQYPWCFPVKSWWVPVEKKTAKFREYQHASHVWNNQNSRTCSESLNIFCCSIFHFFFGCSMLTHLYQTNIEKWCSCMQYWALAHVPFILRLFNNMGCGRVGLWRVLISLISAGLQTAPNGSRPLDSRFLVGKYWKSAR